MRQWAILIGLNNYQMFQPLNCAQQDAQALHQHLIQEVGFPPEQCLLLTDASPQISGRPTQPTRANLQSWIELLTQQCFKPGDLLWFFFSGYGVCSQGRDYLVPLDGDPFAVETTCILMSDIFSRLQASLSPGLPLVLLDINRSQGNYSNEHVGTQTVRLAKQLAVPAILSCQPGQYSRDISGLGHGLFTVALLEALRYHQAATPETLMRFLSDRLPELGGHYFLPNQHPLPTCPPDKLHQPLIQAHFPNQWNGSSNGNGASATLPPDANGYQPVSMDRFNLASATAIAEPIPVATSQPTTLDQPTLTTPIPNYPPPSLPVSTTSSEPHSTISQSQPPLPAPEPTSAVPDEPLVESSSSSTLWRYIMLGGVLLSFGLIACVLWRNWATILAPSTPKTPNSVVVAPVTGAPQADAPTDMQSTSSTVATSPTNPPAPNATPTAPLPDTAILPTDQALNFNPAPSAAVLSGDAILQNARQQVMSDQATPYRNAIDATRQIQPTDPAYVAAQQDIAAWSQRIFTIAQQRATQKQWDIAIMAASLVPEDDRKLHPQALALITEWCPAIASQTADTFTMQKAKAICSQKPI